MKMRLFFSIASSLCISALFAQKIQGQQQKTYFERLPADVGRKVQELQAMNILESSKTREDAIDYLKFLKEANPDVFKNDSFVYAYLNRLAEKFPFPLVYPTIQIKAQLKILIDQLESQGANQWLRDYQLVEAIYWENIKTVQELLAEGANASAQVQGSTPLIYASGRKTLNKLKLLLENGANPNIPDRHGQTPLMHAIVDHNLEGVKLLLKYHANPQLNDMWGSSALVSIFGAIREISKYSEDSMQKGILDIINIIQLFLNSGADINAQNNDKKSVLQATIDFWNHEEKYPAQKVNAYKIIFPPIIEFLKSKGAK